MTVEFLQILLYSTCVCANLAQIRIKKDTITVDDMKKEAEREARTMWQFVRTFLKWLVIAGVTGGIGGLVGSAFHLSVNWAAAFRAAHPWLLWLLPVGGLLIAAIYRLTKMENKNTNAIIDAIHFGDKVPLLLVPAIYLSTVITHLFGGSAGREGAALQIGGSLGCYIGQLFHLDEKDMRIATLCGMSAVFSALVRHTADGDDLRARGHQRGCVLLLRARAVHRRVARRARDLERPSARAERSLHSRSRPCRNCCCCAWRRSAAVCSLMSILFCVTMHGTERLFASRIPNTWLRIAAGGAIVVVLSLLVGTGDYNGAGMDVITRAIEGGQAAPDAFFWKLLFTAVTIGSGFKGGEVVPTFFIGATLGCVLGGLLGIPAGFAAALGLVCVFCGAVNCPDRVNGAEHRTLRRGAARVLRARVRHRLHALGLLWALQQPEDPLFQAPDGVYQHPREIKCKRHARTRNVSGHFFESERNYIICK